MTYYYSTRLADITFEDAVIRTTEALQQEGFGIISQIDLQETFRKKLGVEFRRYVILGACNPTLAHEALQLEDKVGTMLPCNVIVQEIEHGVEVAAVNPVASMQAIANSELAKKAASVGDKLRSAIESLAQ